MATKNLIEVKMHFARFDNIRVQSTEISARIVKPNTNLHIPVFVLVSNFSNNCSDGGDRRDGGNSPNSLFYVICIGKVKKELVRFAGFWRRQLSSGAKELLIEIPSRYINFNGCMYNSLACLGGYDDKCDFHRHKSCR